MRIYLLTNDEARPRHVQVREGDVSNAESNSLTFDGILAPGEGARLFCHTKFAFSRSRYVDSFETMFSEWVLIRDASTRPIEKSVKKQYSETEILNMIRLFEARTLPEDQFTHDAHIIVACWYLFENKGHETFKTVKQHIIAYKAANSTGDAKAFHETLTRFWLLVVREFLNVHKPVTIEVALNKLLMTELSEKSLPFQFYSRERLFSASAIESWMEPDVQSIDKLFQLVKSVKYVRE